MYFTLSPGLAQSAYFRHKIKRNPPPSQVVGYAMEQSDGDANPGKSESPTNTTQLPLAERIRANSAEFERLHKWQDALRVRKRDLLNSDAAGNRAYALELARYNEAFQKAQSEHDSIAAGH